MQGGVSSEIIGFLLQQSENIKIYYRCLVMVCRKEVVVASKQELSSG